MIRPYTGEAVVFDFFAGTGAFGFEALSNGAKKAYFVDDKTGAIIKKNADKLHVPETEYSIINRDFRKAAENLKAQGIKAGIIFLDPPYNKGLIRIFLQMEAINDILDAHGLIVAEIHSEELGDTGLVRPGFNVLKDKKYGDTHILLLEKGGEANG